MHQTHFIRRRQASNFAPAIRRAEQLAVPLNQFVTINFTLLGFSHETASRAFAKLRDNHFGPWYRRAGRSNAAYDRAAFVWVLENVNGHTAAHWLVHIPPEYLSDFTARLSKWLARIAVVVTVPTDAIDIRAAYNSRGARQYMLKGIDPAYQRFYRIRHEPQGLIVGKRLGFSVSLGPSACRDARTYWTQMRADGFVAQKAARAILPPEKAA